MMGDDEFMDCVWKCVRECEDRECRTAPRKELDTGILFLCSIDCETKCIEECRLQTNKPSDGK